MHKIFIDSKTYSVFLFLVFYSFLFLGFISFFYSSLYSLIFLFIVMVVFTKFMALRVIRYPIFLLAFIDLVIIYASKNFHSELTFDLKIYYNIFNLLQSNPVAGFDFFGKAGEFGWSFLYYIVGSFFPNISEIELAVINTIISFFIIFLWIELKVVKNINKYEIGILYFFILLFLNISMLGYLQRQALTIGFLLFALTSKNNRNFILFSLLACFFHLSSVLVILFIYIARVVNFDIKKIILFCFGSLIFRFLLTFIAVFVLSYFGVGDVTRKFQNFSNGTFDVTSLRYPILMLVPLIISIINMKFIDFKRQDNITYIYNFTIISAISIIFMIGVPLFADRIFMISLIIYGVYYYLFFYRRYKLLALILSFLYLIVFIGERINLIGGLPMDDFYWARYPIENYFLDLF